MAIVFIVELYVECQPLLHQQVRVVLVELGVPLRVDVRPVERVLALWAGCMTIHHPILPAILTLLLFLINIAFARIELPLVTRRHDVQLLNGNSESEFLI